MTTPDNDLMTTPYDDVQRHERNRLAGTIYYDALLYLVNRGGVAELLRIVADAIAAYDAAPSDNWDCSPMTIHDSP